MLNDVALDWLKYSANCWIVYTTETPESLYQKLLTIPGMREPSILIVEFDMSPNKRSGQFPKWIWDWFSKSR